MSHVDWIEDWLLLALLSAKESLHLKTDESSKAIPNGSPTTLSDERERERETVETSLNNWNVGTSQRLPLANHAMSKATT